METPGPSSVEIETMVLDIIKKFPNGVSDAKLRKDVPNLTTVKCVEILNNLVVQEHIVVLNQGDRFLYKMKTKVPEVLQKADTEEKVVFSIIQESGTKGIWIKTIRAKSNLTPTVLNKILKSLENKKIIKSVKTVKDGNKKVYMLYDLEPDRSLTGGIWYSNQDFDSEFVDVLNGQCYRYLQMKGKSAENNPGGPLIINHNSYASVGEILKFINDLKISTIQLTEEDVKTILLTLIYDGKAQMKASIDGSTLYKAVVPFLPDPGVMSNPCGICPVIRNCEESCAVNPKCCTYFADWLEQ